jgi:putative heme-binding domain-containing protein
VGIAASNDPRQGAELARHVAAKESDESTRQAMLRLLVNFRGSDPAMDKAVSEHLKELLRSKNPETLALALDVSASLKAPTPEVGTILLDLLKRPLPTPARKAILDGLSKVPTDENRSAIIRSLQDADAELATHGVKLLGSKALASVKGEDVSRALIDALKRDATRKEAAIALGNRKDSLAVPALVAISKDQEAGFDAVNALAQMPDARAAAVYLEHADSKNPHQRFACMKALEAVKNDALPLIEARLGQQPPLSAETVLGLQKIYANDPQVRGGALFKLAPKSIAAADFMNIALREKGNPDRGRAMFMDVKRTACIKCHTTGGEVKGGDVGPDLRSIAVKYNRTQIAESVLDPSKQILDGYEVTIIETDSGEILDGVVRGESEEELTLVDAEGKRTTLGKKTVKSRRKSKISMMPDGLHVGMTTSEFADLIAYLETLNEKPPAKK